MGRGSGNRRARWRATGLWAGLAAMLLAGAGCDVYKVPSSWLPAPLTVDGDSADWGDLPFFGIAQPTDPGVQLPWNWYGVWKATHVIGDPRRNGQSSTAGLHIGPLGDGRMVGLYWATRRLNRGRQLADEFLLLRFPARGR